MSAIPGINFPQSNESTHDRLDSSWEVPWFFGLFPAHLLSATHPTLRRASRLPRLVPRTNLNSVDPSQIFPEHERGLHLKGFFCMEINRGSQMRCYQWGTKGTPCCKDHTAELRWPWPWPGARCVVLPIFWDIKISRLHPPHQEHGKFKRNITFSLMKEITDVLILGARKWNTAMRTIRRVFIQ